MLAVLSLACATGTGLGLARLKVWAIIPVSAVFAVVVVVLSSHLGLTWSRQTSIVFAVLMLLQVSYLLGTVLSAAQGRRAVTVDVPAKQDLIHIVQTAIADELPRYFELPPLDDLPPQLHSKLALLATR